MRATGLYADRVAPIRPSINPSARRVYCRELLVQRPSPQEDSLITMKSSQLSGAQTFGCQVKGDCSKCSLEMANCSSTCCSG